MSRFGWKQQQRRLKTEVSFFLSAAFAFVSPSKSDRQKFPRHANQRSTGAGLGPKTPSLPSKSNTTMYRAALSRNNNEYGLRQMRRNNKRGEIE